MLSRRLILLGVLLASAIAFSATSVLTAHAADALKVGILIPGSKSDKGWMESGYDGLTASEKKYGDKIKVQMIENINYADMEQALTNLATSTAQRGGLRREAGRDRLRGRRRGRHALQDRRRELRRRPRNSLDRQRRQRI